MALINDPRVKNIVVSIIIKCSRVVLCDVLYLISSAYSSVITRTFRTIRRGPLRSISLQLDNTTSLAKSGEGTPGSDRSRVEGCSGRGCHGLSRPLVTITPSSQGSIEPGLIATGDIKPLSNPHHSVMHSRFHVAKLM